MFSDNMSWIIIISIIFFAKITITWSANDFEHFYSARSNSGGHYTEAELEEHEQSIYVGQDRDYDDFPENPYKFKGKYPCLRHCGRNFKPELCYYKFKLERYQTFSKNCDPSPFTKKKYFDDGCITADGRKMRIMTVNKMLPGTAVHICQGDTLVVDVENLLPGGRSASIHWHGIKHPHSQWMDGVSFLTQCPIQPGQKFRYEFQALEAGTFFYHASDNEQHVAGLAGPLIIRSKEDGERNWQYNTDLYSHTIFIQDVMHEKDDFIFPFTDNRGRFLSPSSYLINGRGQYKEKGRFGFSKRTNSPFAEFWVEVLAKARLRIIAATNSSCSFKVAIEKHVMTVIAVDGKYITPVDVGTIHMHSGERVDVVINASLKWSQYWIRVQGNDFCSSARQSAILHYKDTKKNILSSKSSKKIFTQFSKILPDLNNFSLGCGNPNKNLCWQDLQPEEKIPEVLLESAGVRLKEIRAARIKLVDRAVAESPVSKEKFNLAFGDDYLDELETFDNISCQLPPFALLKQFYENMPENLECDREDSKLKICFYVIELELDEVIDIVFMDATHIDFSGKKKKDRLFTYDRSIHFHGHSVLILRQGTMDDYKRQSNQDSYHSKGTISNRIFKDTVSIPKDGFTMVRFQASNPGIWALETPLTDGNSEGVALAFQVGNKSFNLSGIYTPFSLPECKDFLPAVKKLPKPIEENQEENVENLDKGNEGSSSYKYSSDGKKVEDEAEESSLEKKEGEITVPMPLALPPRLRSPSPSPSSSPVKGSGKTLFSPLSPSSSPVKETGKTPFSS